MFEKASYTPQATSGERFQMPDISMQSAPPILSLQPTSYVDRATGWAIEWLPLRRNLSLAVRRQSRFVPQLGTSYSPSRRTRRHVVAGASAISLQYLQRHSSWLSISVDKGWQRRRRLTALPS